MPECTTPEKRYTPEICILICATVKDGYDRSKSLHCSYRHAGAALGEVHHSGVELVFEQVRMSHHSSSQRQAGGGHQGCSYHLGLSC